jgi:hypothetical protein
MVLCCKYRSLFTLNFYFIELFSSMISDLASPILLEYSSDSLFFDKETDDLDNGGHEALKFSLSSTSATELIYFSDISCMKTSFNFCGW